MKGKFIYCYDKELLEKFNKLNLIYETDLDNKHCWIFENDNKIKFSIDDNLLDKVKFTSKLYI